jgi:hypothetical protein
VNVVQADEFRQSLDALAEYGCPNADAGRDEPYPGADVSYVEPGFAPTMKAVRIPRLALEDPRAEPGAER